MGCIYPSILKTTAPTRYRHRYNWLPRTRHTLGPVGHGFPRKRVRSTLHFDRRRSRRRQWAACNGDGINPTDPAIQLRTLASPHLMRPRSRHIWRHSGSMQPSHAPRPGLPQLRVPDAGPIGDGDTRTGPASLVFKKTVGPTRWISSLACNPLPAQSFLKRIEALSQIRAILQLRRASGSRAKTI